MVATPSRIELYTKYFPSGVQAPQHSPALSFPGGVLPAANKGCKSVPVGETSHSEFSWFLIAVKRRTLASGDQRGSMRSYPGKVTILREPLPSALTINNSWALE
jgi:hypothetical protein